MEHNFERLKAHILALSKAKHFDAARKEWRWIGVEVTRDRPRLNRKRKEAVQGRSSMGRFHPGVGSCRSHVPFGGQEAVHGRRDFRPAMGGRLRHWFDGGVWHHS